MVKRSWHKIDILLMLQPVKRITEYPILLEKLLKHTRYQDTEVLLDHPDRENIEEALKIAKSVCDQVSCFCVSQFFTIIRYFFFGMILS